MAEPVVIEVRCNEAAERDGNPALPYGPQEVVTELLASARAGASVLHWHARDADGTERADDVALYREVIRGVRESSRDTVLHPTLGFMATQGDARGRMRHILELMEDPQTRVDVVPVDFGAYGADLWDAAGGRFRTGDRFVVNEVGYLRELLGVIAGTGLAVYPVVWSAGGVRTARSLQAEGLLPRTSVWCLGFTGDEVPGGPPPTPANLQTFLDELPPGDPWTVHCRNGDVLPLAAWAITRGGHVSIGLGDFGYDRFGAPRNSELVARVAGLAETLGRPVATPAQAREILGLDPA
ncbi:3-keto-5-aminohexanoate cleavage protein [Pseudonocardia spirodelae]|uniref:3-keto-5-aminohexanoate cleavage protein n=1 Tax=Pseudonocardia spirodelae TaxID=3133431 RepID=A0ABU8TA07_9PSEU